MTEPFRVIAADCPWKFGDNLPGDGRGASKHYRCMSTCDLCNFPLPPIANDAVLFFWRVAALQRESLNVIDAWGFEVKTEIIWLKKTVHGRRWFGMGRITRAEHEVCLVATRGRPEVLDHSQRSTFVTEVPDFEGLSATTGRHSEKPDEFYRIVETLYAGPRVELFARKQRPGWTVLGNEVA